MKVNGNLKVLGDADISLYERQEHEIQNLKDNSIFLFQDKLCYKQNGQLHIILNTTDISLHKVFGDFITPYNQVNVSKVNEALDKIGNINNNENLLNIIEILAKNIIELKDKIIQLENDISSKAQYLKPQNKINSNKDEGITIHSREKKKIHIIEHGLDKKYCMVQIIDDNDTALDSSNYQLKFKEIGRFLVKLNQESPITVLVS